MCVCVCVCVRVCCKSVACECVCECVRVRACMPACVRVCACVRVLACVRACVRARECVQVLLDIKGFLKKTKKLTKPLLDLFFLFFFFFLFSFSFSFFFFFFFLPSLYLRAASDPRPKSALLRSSYRPQLSSKETYNLHIVFFSGRNSNFKVRARATQSPQKCL